MYNKLPAKCEERSFDATKFVSYLQEQLSTKGLYFAIQTVEDSSMSKVFWILTDSFERWIEFLMLTFCSSIPPMIQINMLLSLPLFVQSINMVVLKFWHVHYLIVKRRKHLLGHSMNPETISTSTENHYYRR